MDGFTELVRDAQRLGEIQEHLDAVQLAFELYSFMELTNFHFVLFKDPKVLEQGRKAVADRLSLVAVPSEARAG
jgi:hypothetical protein